MQAQKRRAFTLIELLVVIVILMILAAMTVGTLRASRSHQILEQAAARVELLLDTARAAAAAEREPVFLAMAETGPLKNRALILLKDLNSPVALRDWQILPPGVLLMEDDTPNLLQMDDIQTIDILTVGDITSAARVLLEVGPDGRFRVQVGTERRSELAHLLLQRVLDSPDSRGNPVPVSPVDALRIDLRPLTGATRVERVLP